ncbi:MAG: N-acetylmuramoyl-L-alanine amidase [bacterium]
MKVVNDKLQGVEFVKSDNVGGALDPDTLVIHYTAGRDAKSAVRTLTSPNVKASAHLVVGRDGSVTQLVPFNVVAWHAGKSAYGGRTGFNQYSIGIEIDNAGLLSRQGDTYTAWFGRVYQQKEVLRAVHRNETLPQYWHRYTEEQITLVEEICDLLINAYNIKMILGHEEISPGRKIDPGPAFPLDKLRQKLLHGHRHEDEGEAIPFPVPGVIKAGKLNIRSGPTVHADRIAKPLMQGKQVTVKEMSKDWYRVSAEIEGWVSAQFVELQEETEV